MMGFLGPRRRGIKIAGAVAVFLVACFFLAGRARDTATDAAADVASWAHPNPLDPRRLHLLIPATSSNRHLCQLMTSAAVMGYPAPVLVNWGAPEAADAYEQHIIKVEAVVNYTQDLPASQHNDLVFMMDGYDAWFQLPPDVLIRKYYEVVQQASRRHAEHYGPVAVAEHDIRNTVLFGPDKVCWPPGDERAACWAVPEAYLPPKAFGPDTDHGIFEHGRARWLNSGTAMGTAEEMRRVFEATLDKIHDHYHTNSDQFYFAEVYADQSYKRLLIRLEYDRARGKDVSLAEAHILPNEHNKDEKEFPTNLQEYYLGLDMDSAIWQTIAFYEDYVAWIRHNETSATSYGREDSRSINPYHYFPFPPELQGRSPISDTVAQTIRDTFTPQKDHDLGEDLKALSAWANLPIAFNTISKTTPPVLHFTGKKQYRDMWWPRNWFYPFQAEILRGMREAPPGSGARPRATGKYRDALAGAWTYYDREFGWQSWEDLCGEHEEILQGKRFPDA